MQAFSKRSTASKILLKLQSSEAYKNYKFQLALSKCPPLPDLHYPKKDAYHFKHSGNAGDIIYALPTIYALAGDSAIHLHLHINQPAAYGKNTHPLGNVMLNEKMVAMLQPLLLAQPNIKTCTIYDEATHVDFDLDLMRRYPIPLSRGHIARWYFYVFGLNADLGKPWLKAAPEAAFSDHIILARSQRYQSPGINYGFLKKFDKLLFVGLEAEWRDMQQALPNLKHQPVKNFLELAQIIAGSKLFIGNQSFPFAIAEGLKVRRLLEVYHLAPNVVAEGANGYDFMFQAPFEKLVHELYETSV